MTSNRGSMRYRTLVADPPWAYDEGFVSIWPKTSGFQPDGVRRGGEVATRTLPYDSMSLDQIKALPVTELADPEGSTLFMWTTNRYLPDAFDVVRSWGFTYRQTIVWHKTNPAPFSGAVAPNAAEYLLYARRGNARLIGRASSCVLSMPRPKAAGVTYSRGDHSSKPEAFLDLVEQVSPGPYLELFARRNRLGWDTWGDEVLEHVEVVA